MSARDRFSLFAVWLPAALAVGGCSPAAPPQLAPLANAGSGVDQVVGATTDGSVAAPAAPAVQTPAAVPAVQPAAPVAEQPAGEAAAAAPPTATTSCRMVPVPDSGGAMTCSEGCVLIKGAPIAEDAGCALIGPQNEIALGCVGTPIDVVEAGACWVNAAGVHVVTAFLFPGLLDAGWRLCPDDYPHRAAAPCGEQGAAPTAGGDSGPRQGLLLAPDGSVVRDGSGATQ